MPNFYGESPAVQVMPIKSGEKIDTSLLQSIERALEKSQLKNTGLILENFNIKVKFKTAEDQLKAKTVIQNSLGDKYVVALNLISNSPNWLSNMGALPMYLGLDLRGGVHFLMQVDLSKALEKTTASYLTQFRTNLRKEKVGYYDATRINDIMQIKFKSKEELLKIFQNLKILNEKNQVFTCGSGVTACILAMANKIISDKNPVIYDGSWSEYGLK